MNLSSSGSHFQTTLDPLYSYQGKSTLHKSQILQPRARSEQNLNKSFSGIQTSYLDNKPRLSLSQLLSKTKKSPTKLLTPPKTQRMSIERLLKREDGIAKKEENDIQGIMNFIEKFRLEKQKALEQQQIQIQQKEIPKIPSSIQKKVETPKSQPKVNPLVNTTPKEKDLKQSLPLSETKNKTPSKEKEKVFYSKLKKF